MDLIGLYDSPYVRRTAITLHAMGLAFKHTPLSVFSTYDAFTAINPVVKAPSLITDDGTVLLESTLIVEYAQRLVAPQSRLVPDDLADFARSQRIIGLALAACEKTVQIVYENNLRPAEKRHQPWIDRVAHQLDAAYRLLEVEAETTQPWFFGATMTQADITTAVAYDFTCKMLPDVLDMTTHGKLAALSAQAEGTAPFLACPFR